MDDFLYAGCAVQMPKMLRNLSSWIDEAVDYASSREFDPDLLLAERLNPDMFALVRQVQSACDGAKFGAARLTGTKPASDPDDETTVAQLKARIAKTVATLEGLTSEQFAGAAEREIAMPVVAGMACTGSDYFIEFVQPNFYFHISMSYGLLRRAGVQLGKRRYIGSVNLFPATS